MRYLPLARSAKLAAATAITATLVISLGGCAVLGVSPDEPTAQIARPHDTVDPRNTTSNPAPARTEQLPGVAPDPTAVSPQGVLPDPYANPR